MSIIPGAVVQAKYDLTRSFFGKKRTYPLTAGTNVAEEGALLIQTAGTSSITASVATGASGEIPLGVAMHSFIKGTTFTKYELLSVPAVAPYTVQLAHPLLINAGAGVAEAAVYDVTNTAYLLVAAAPIAGTAGINVTSGLMTFDVAQAGISFWVRYRYTMSVTERDNLIRASHINRGADDQFEAITVGMGHCRIFTTMYNAAGAWELLTQSYTAAADESPCLGADGLWSTNTLHVNGTMMGRVISLPTADDPYLGLEFNTDVFTAV